MKVKIIGYQTSIGDFTPQGSNQVLHYDNYIFYYTHYYAQEGVTGTKTGQLKIRRDLFTNKFRCNPEDVVGKFWDLDYSDTRQLVGVNQFVPQEKK